MTECEVVTVGDLHLGACQFLADFVEDTDSMIYRALDNAVSYAHENGIENLIILGDIFDHPNPTQEDQKRLLAYLNATNLNVHAIYGNHDVTSDGDHSLIMPEFFTKQLNGKVHIYIEPTVVDIDGIDFCMMPWPHTKSLLKGPGVNIAHVTLAKAKSDSGRMLTKGKTIKERDNQYWKIGDIHRYQQYSKLVNYQGMMYSKTFGEMGPKGFGHLSARIKSGKLQVKDEFIITKPPYELVNLRIDEPSDLEKIKPFDKNELTLYKLKMSKDVVLPASYKKTHPHVKAGWNKEQKIVDKQGQEVVISGELNDPLKDLEMFLKKEGLNAGERQRAIEYASKKVAQLNEGL